MEKQRDMESKREKERARESRNLFRDKNIGRQRLEAGLQLPTSSRVSTAFSLYCTENLRKC